jgi:peptide/nickel transport system substrate-binding protein
LTTVEAARLGAAGGFQTSIGSSGSWAHVDFNLDDPWLKDARVRRALAASIDRAGAIRGVFGDAYTIADSFLPPVHPLFSADAKAQGFDAALAARLFDEAGWTRTGDGVRKNAAGAPLHLVLASASGQADAEKLLVVLQSQWRAAGVSVELDLRPFAAFFQDGVKKRGFKHLAFYAWTMGPTTTGDTMWRADRVPSAENRFAGKNIPGWRDDEVTKLLTDVEVTLDERERKRMLAVVQRRFVEDLPSIPMYFKPTIAVFRTGVTGVQPTGTTTPTTWNAEAWDAAAKQP